MKGIFEDNWVSGQLYCLLWAAVHPKEPEVQNSLLSVSDTQQNKLELCIEIIVKNVSQLAQQILLHVIVSTSSNLGHSLTTGITYC